MNAIHQHSFARAAPVPVRPSARPATLPRMVLRGYDELGPGDRLRWAELAARAASPNIFVHDWFMDAAIGACDPASRPRLLVALGDDGRWLGVLPLASDPSLGRWPVRNWRLWSATNQFLLTPLVVPEAADAFWRAALADLDARGGHGALHCPLLTAVSPVTRALLARCEADARPCHPLETILRPARLASRPPEEREPVPRKAQRKLESRLRNLARRLSEDHGPLDLSLWPGDADPGGWLDDFLRLESAGWKGRSGSALRCEGATEALFRTVIERGWERGAAHLATMRAGDRIVAMTSWLVTGDQGFGFKMAYDEEFARYAPGQLLMQFVGDRISVEPALDFDTCSAPESQHCKYFWPDRREIIGRVVSVGSPLAQLKLRLLMGLRAAMRQRRGDPG